MGFLQVGERIGDENQEPPARGDVTGGVGDQGGGGGGRVGGGHGEPEDTSDLGTLTAPSDDGAGGGDNDGGAGEDDKDDEEEGEVGHKGNGGGKDNGGDGGAISAGKGPETTTTAAKNDGLVEDGGGQAGPAPGGAGAAAAGAGVGGGLPAGAGGVLDDTDPDFVMREERRVRLNGLVEAAVSRQGNHECNVAFVKTHKTASTTLTAIMYRYGLRHGRRVARFHVEGTAVTLEHAAREVSELGIKDACLM